MNKKEVESMKNYEEINDILMENIRILKKLDIKDEHARDEIMKGNAIQSTAKALIQLEIAKMAIEKQREAKNLLNAKDYMVE